MKRYIKASDSDSIVKYVVYRYGYNVDYHSDWFDTYEEAKQYIFDLCKNAMSSDDMQEIANAYQSTLYGSNGKSTNTSSYVIPPEWETDKAFFDQLKAMQKELSDRYHSMEKAQKAAKRKASTSSKSGVTLEVAFEPYERYEKSRTKKAKIKGANLHEALCKMCDKMMLYLDSEQIEDEELTDDEIIDQIEMSNGDGCDYIIYLKDLTNGVVLINGNYDESEEEW